MDFFELQSLFDARVVASNQYEHTMTAAAAAVPSMLSEKLGLEQGAGWMEGERLHPFVQPMVRDLKGAWHDVPAQREALVKYVDPDALQLVAGVRVQFQPAGRGKREVTAAYSVRMKDYKVGYRLVNAHTGEAVGETLHAPVHMALAILAHFDEALRYDPASGPVEPSPIGFVRPSP